MLLMLMWTVVCLFLGLIPEALMWAVWDLVGPVSFWEKAVTIFLLGTFGMALAIFAAMGSFVLWVGGIQAVDKVY